MCSLWISPSLTLTGQLVRLEPLTLDMCIGDAGYFQVLRRDLDGATFAGTESS